MIYVVVKDNKAISFLFHSEQQEFLRAQDSELAFVPIDVEWDAENPILLNQCVVQPDGSVRITAKPTE